MNVNEAIRAAVLLPVTMCCYALLSIGAAPAHANDSIALVIANSRYPYQPLQRTEAASRAVASALQRSGFSVRFVADADQETIEQSLYEFGEKVKNAEMSLLYFAGHVLQIEGESYLLPVGRTFRAGHDVKYGSPSLSRLIRGLEGGGRRGRMLIVDGAYPQELAKAVGVRSPGFAEPTQELPDRSLLALSDRPGQETPLSAAFGRALSAALRQSPRSPERLLKQVQIDVGAATGGAQMPWFQSTLSGGLALGNAAAPGLSGRSLDAAAPAGPDADEQAIWDDIDHRDGDEVAAFIEIFPDGYYIDQARLELQGLRRGSVMTASRGLGGGPETQEAQFWQAVVAEGGSEYYQKYLELYPDGYYRQQAVDKLQQPSGRAELAARSLAGENAAEVWERVKDSGDAAALEQFVNLYPHSPLASLAMLKRDQLGASAPGAADQLLIDELLARAERAFGRNDLLTAGGGRSDTAVAMAGEVLAVTPEHPEALAMMRRVIDKYLNWGVAQAGRGDSRRAGANLGKAESLARYASAEQLARLERGLVLLRSGPAAVAAAAPRRAVETSATRPEQPQSEMERWWNWTKSNISPSKELPDVTER